MGVSRLINVNIGPELVAIGQLPYICGKKTENLDILLLFVQ